MTGPKRTPAYRDPARPLAERVADLPGRMSVGEKPAQIRAVWATAVLDGDRFSETKTREALPHGTGHVSRIRSTTVLCPRDSAPV